ncbi:hypothetical protein, conserved [Eimeria necatrix]|uniref:Transmembrane protein n=1 Tax=Eimeria necatrix TaxID=51315 RepID=U6MU69_9EIME|nr:hypothetical protein, conserved [Eimeria necatrix]CDJ66618.1 hypothetical protein, conserved [Eimeria necatrix]
MQEAGETLSGGRNGSFCSQEHSVPTSPLGTSIAFDAVSGLENLPSSSERHVLDLLNSCADNLQDNNSWNHPVVSNNGSLETGSKEKQQLTPQTEGPSDAEEESATPFDKRPSYIRIARRLQRIRVLPALISCFFALLVTCAVCGAEIAISSANLSSSIAFICCSVVGCILGALAAWNKSHVLLVGLVLLEVLYALYSIAFAAVGLSNVRLLQTRQQILQQDGTMQPEQRENALKITRRMLIEQAIFAGLYFFIAAAHCCAAASANHLRATVRPFDSRLRRKRQRARAMRKLNLRLLSVKDDSAANSLLAAAAQNPSKDLQDAIDCQTSQNNKLGDDDSHLVDTVPPEEELLAKNSASISMENSSFDETGSYRQNAWKAEEIPHADVS